GLRRPVGDREAAGLDAFLPTGAARCRVLASFDGAHRGLPRRAAALPRRAHAADRRYAGLSAGITRVQPGPATDPGPGYFLRTAEGLRVHARRGDATRLEKAAGFSLRESARS